jgi:hypothetical protein
MKKKETEKIEFYLEGICEIPAYQRQLVDDVVNHADTITLQPGRYLPSMLEVLVGRAIFSNSVTGKTIMHPEAEIYHTAPQPAIFPYLEKVLEPGIDWGEDEHPQPKTFRIKKIELPTFNNQTKLHDYLTVTLFTTPITSN